MLSIETRIRVAIYCRLSDADRNKKSSFDDSESIQNQKNLLIKRAKEEGWEIYDIYSDDDYTGQDEERPDVNRLIQDARAKKFDVVLCKSQARFGRDAAFIERYLRREFPELGISFVSITDNIDTADESRDLQSQMQAVIDDNYCATTSRNIKVIIRDKQSDGKFLGSFACFGYQKDPNNKNRLIIDEEAAEIVRKIFNLYLHGHGVQHIASILNDEGIPNPTKYKNLKGSNFINSSSKDDYGIWNKTTVKRILQNEIYIGTMVQHKRKKVNYKSKKVIGVPSAQWIRVKDTHDPIIDTETFKAVQDRFKANVRSDGTGSTHIFAGKVKCMTCKNTMLKSSNGEGYSYLKCKLYTISPKKNLCTSHTIRLELLHEVIKEKVNMHIRELCDLDSVLTKASELGEKESKKTRLEKQMKKIEKEIKIRDEALGSLYLNMVRGIITSEQLIELNNKFTNEKNKLIMDRDNIENILRGIQDDYDIEKRLSIIKEYKDIKELNHFIVNKLIDVIEIDEEDSLTGTQEIKVHWNF